MVYLVIAPSLKREMVIKGRENISLLLRPFFLLQQNSTEHLRYKICQYKCVTPLGYTYSWDLYGLPISNARFCIYNNNNNTKISQIHIAAKGEKFRNIIQSIQLGNRFHHTLKVSGSRIEVSSQELLERQ